MHPSEYLPGELLRPLLDIQMPLLNGLELAKKIRKNTQFNELIIIAVTAEDAAQEVVYGLNNNLYKNVELIVESENDRPAYVEVDI